MLIMLVLSFILIVLLVELVAVLLVFGLGFVLGDLVEMGLIQNPAFECHRGRRQCLRPRRGRLLRML